MVNPYDVAPIDRAKNEIRLIKLEPGDDTAIIRCNVRTFLLSDKRLPYVALSYSWGAQERYQDIELNGVSVPVGRSLWFLLDRTRKKADRRETLLWIDALCINQLDAQERNHQVQLMRYIYGNADTVWVWLGEGFDRSDLAMDYLARSKPFHRKIDASELWNEQEGSAMVSLCQRNYWSRIWIVQEIMLARSMTIMCGNKDIEWNKLQQLLVSLPYLSMRRYPSYRRVSMSLHLSQAMVIIGAKANWGDVQALTTLIKLYRYQQSSDIRDKVYGLHGLACDTDAIKIDYSIDARTLMIQVLRHVASSSSARNRTVRSASGLLYVGSMMNDVLQTGLSDRHVMLLVLESIHAYWNYEYQIPKFRPPKPMISRRTSVYSAQLCQCVHNSGDHMNFERFNHNTPGVLVTDRSLLPHAFRDPDRICHSCRHSRIIQLRCLKTSVLPFSSGREPWGTSRLRPFLEHSNQRDSPSLADLTMMTASRLIDNGVCNPNQDSLVTSERNVMIVGAMPITQEHQQLQSSLQKASHARSKHRVKAATYHRSPPQVTHAKVPKPRPPLSCIFWYLECSYLSHSESEWRKHCTSHLRSIEPPRTYYCQTCSSGGQRCFDTGWAAWESRLQHYLDKHAPIGSKMISDSSVVGAIPFLLRMKRTLSEREFNNRFGRYWYGTLFYRYDAERERGNRFFPHSTQALSHDEVVSIDDFRNARGDLGTLLQMKTASRYWLDSRASWGWDSL